jgi:hypothetical protein
VERYAPSDSKNRFTTQEAIYYTITDEKATGNENDKNNGLRIENEIITRPTKG